MGQCKPSQSAPKPNDCNSQVGAKKNKYQTQPGSQQGKAKRK